MVSRILTFSQTTLWLLPQKRLEMSLSQIIMYKQQSLPKRLKLSMTTHYGSLNYLICFIMKGVCRYLNVYEMNIVAREDEDRRRRENMLLEEERLRREKDDLDFRY
jgi:hypothetical protein